RTVLREIRQRLDEQGLRPAMLTTALGGPRGVRARTMAVHGIPAFGLLLALDRSQAMPIQVHAAPRRNGVPAHDPGGFLWVLDKRLLTYPIQGLDYTLIDGLLSL